jgi:hypothetical protein
MIEKELVKWVINQGVAVAFAAFILVRIEGKLNQIIQKLDKLVVN